jgi:hypothetical protein
MNRKRALELIAQGNSVLDTAAELKLAPQPVRRLLRQGLASESLFLNELTREKVSELRQIEGEKLSLAWRRVADAFAAVDPSNGIVVVRLAEASAKLSERQAKLWGLEQPIRIVEESLRLQVSRELTAGPIRIIELEPVYPNDDSAKLIEIDLPEAPEDRAKCDPATIQMAEDLLRLRDKRCPYSSRRGKRTHCAAGRRQRVDRLVHGELRGCVR